MSTFYKAIPVQRGCGTRQESGIYLECGVGPFGLPLESYLMDPPILIPPGLPVPAQGMGLIHGANGIWHLVDRIGLSHYPSSADFIEEVRRFGLSRRIQKNLKATVDGQVVCGFSLLTKDSRIFSIHDKGHVTIPAATPKYPFGGWKIDVKCPSGKHPDPTQHPCVCACQAYHVVEQHPGDKPLPSAGPDQEHSIRFERKMPSFSYVARRFAEGPAAEVVLKPAIIASWPISALVVIEGDDQTEALSLAKQSKLPVRLEKQ